MKKEELNTLIDNTMNSLEGIERAEANPFIARSVTNRLSQIRKAHKPSGYVWKLAAVFAVLICVNLFMILNYLQPTPDYTRTAALEILADEYLLNNTNFYY